MPTRGDPLSSKGAKTAKSPDAIITPSPPVIVDIVPEWRHTNDHKSLQNGWRCSTACEKRSARMCVRACARVDVSGMAAYFSVVATELPVLAAELSVVAAELFVVAAELSVVAAELYVGLA